MKTAAPRSVIGRMAVIKHNNLYYEATVIDAVAHTNKAKRVRIQRNVDHGGKVLMPGEYDLVEFVD